jgi:hypothetical protein
MSIKVTNNFKKVGNEINKRAEMFASASTSIGATWSKYWAPVAYSALVNSQKVTITSTVSKVTGIVGFYVDYAKYLENGNNWKPKAPRKYGSAKRGIPAANAWNPQAKPGFLKAGFEDPQPQAEIKSALKIFRSD